MLVDPRRAFPVASLCSGRAEFYQSGMIFNVAKDRARLKLGVPAETSTL